MWCCQCQQDVPATPRRADGALVCPRCRLLMPLRGKAGLRDRLEATGAAGICLEQRGDVQPRFAAPVEALQRERLREIGRRLRQAAQPDWRCASSPVASGGAHVGPHAWRWDRGPALHKSEVVLEKNSPRERVAWGVSLLLILGVSCFCVGLTLLFASTVWGSGLLAGRHDNFLSPHVTPVTLWQWGLTITIAGEGALVVGLAWMAGRLWRNSRRLNRQIDGLEGHLVGLEGLTGKLASSRLSGSQAYYLQSSSVCSPNLALAQLQGQLDQLASQTR